MSSNKNNSYKFIILALSIFLLIVLFKSYKDNKYSKELQDNLKQESILTQNQLSEIIDKYDSISMIYNNYDENFSILSTKTTNSKIAKTEIDYKNLSNLNKQIQTIKDSINLLQEKLTEIEKIKALVKPEAIKTKNIQNATLNSSPSSLRSSDIPSLKP